MTRRYTLGPCHSHYPAYCFIMERGDPVPWGSVFAPTQQEAQTKAQRLIDLLNDPGEPVWVQVFEPMQAAEIIPWRKRQ